MIPNNDINVVASTCVPRVGGGDPDDYRTAIAGA